MHVGAALVFMALLMVPPAGAQTDNLEQRVKAAFIFNFAKFVEWPPEAFVRGDAPLEICVIEGEPLNQTLAETVRGKAINQHPLTVRRVQNGAQLRGCNVLYLGDLEPSRQREFVAVLRGRPVLTVSDTAGFIDDGGMIRFLILDGKVRFEINQGAAERARLAISSQLLSLAHSVVRKSDG
jgi:hypothetical protein